MAGKLRSALMHPGPGFRVQVNFERLPADLMRAFAHFPTPDISDLLNRLYAIDPQIHCLSGEHHRISGPALTVKVFPGDNLMVHKSIDVARPGDVVVVDTSSSMMTAVLGDLVCTKAKYRGIAGFVVDGLIRDLPGILRLVAMVLGPRRPPQLLLRRRAWRSCRCRSTAPLAGDLLPAMAPCGNPPRPPARKEGGGGRAKKGRDGARGGRRHLPSRTSRPPDPAAAATSRA